MDFVFYITRVETHIGHFTQFERITFDITVRVYVETRSRAIDTTDETSETEENIYPRRTGAFAVVYTCIFDATSNGL